MLHVVTSEVAKRTLKSAQNVNIVSRLLLSASEFGMLLPVAVTGLRGKMKCPDETTEEEFERVQKDVVLESFDDEVYTSRLMPKHRKSLTYQAYAWRASTENARCSVCLQHDFLQRLALMEADQDRGVPVRSS
jgi:hypothetical protein